jgi:hypothetical protein
MSADRSAAVFPVCTAFSYHLPSLANWRGHWTKKARLVKAQRDLTDVYLKTAWQPGPRLPAYAPLVVTFTRIAPRFLDDDNLRGAFKAVRDQTAAYLGLRNDNDPRIAWRYQQLKGKPHQYLVRIEIDCANDVHGREP